MKPPKYLPWGVADKGIPITSADDVFAHIDAAYHRDEAGVALSVNILPSDMMLGEFRRISLIVMRHAVMPAQLPDVHVRSKATERMEVSEHKRARFTILTAEIPRTYVTVYYATPKSQDHHAVVFCFPVTVILEACDRRLEKLRSLKEPP